MADVRLDLDEAAGDLPPVCVCCGAPATVFKTKKMFWWPRWTYLLLIVHPFIWGVVALIVSKRANVRAPFCELHEGHWLNRSVLNWGVGALLGLSAGAAFIAEGLPPVDELSGFTCLGGVILLAIWMIFVAIVHSTEIRPRVITRSEIVLQGVSEFFVAAVQEQDRERLAIKIGRDIDDDQAETPTKKNQPGADAIQAERSRANEPPSDAVRE